MFADTATISEATGRQRKKAGEPLWFSAQRKCTAPWADPMAAMVVAAAASFRVSHNLNTLSAYRNGKTIHAEDGQARAVRTT